jgi:hypothetical protein
MKHSPRVGFRPALAFSSLTPYTLYETTPKWYGFLMIKLAAFQASGGARMKLFIYKYMLTE